MKPVNADFCCVNELALEFVFPELLPGLSLDWISKFFFAISTTQKIAKEGLGFKFEFLGIRT